MTRRTYLTFLLLVLACAVAQVGLAQGVQTATLFGTVTAGGEGLPGVTVTATSDKLIGERTTVTGANGDYVLRGLPSGDYTLRFSVDGMQTVERTITAPLGGQARSDAELQPITAVAETIIVRGEAPNPLQTTSVGANYDKSEVDKLPIGRTISEIAAFAPGLTTNAPNAAQGQVTISGSFGYDNVFLVDGVDINDNLFGTPDDLFIEDAIEETQVLTSGISAEYGRFSGGVINAVTKSGGNDFSGSFRADFTKANWRDETPFEKDNGIQREGDLNKVYEATLGGPFVKDRAWFFIAGRDSSEQRSDTLPVTGVVNKPVIDNQRVEAKFTVALTPSHSLQGSYIDNSTDENHRVAFSFTIDPNAAVTDQLPNDGTVLAYTGVFTQNLFGEARWSEKNFGFRNSGGTSSNILDSPFISQGALPGVQPVRHYNAPYFDATDPEDRNNQQVYGAVSYFATSERAGSHDVKVGYERFTSTLTGGNSQSSTNYVFDTDYLVSADGKIQLDNNGRIIPVFTPGLSGLEFWVAERGSQIDITTDSLFINDRWNLNDHWSFSLGARYEQVNSDATGGLTTVDTSRLVPRLGASYDIKGNGKYKVDVTYAEYAGKYSEAQFASNTTVGNPRLLYGYYIGPAGQGLGFAPGFDPNNYYFYFPLDPTANVIVDKNIKSPVTSEYTGAFGVDLGRGGFAKLIYTNRTVADFVEDFFQIENGQTQVTVGGLPPRPADNKVIRNSNLPSRDYEALQLQGRYGITDRWYLNLGWTHQFSNDGNFEGEFTNQPGASSSVGDYPEILGPAGDRYFPTGHLNGYQPDKIRLWSSYALDLGRAGDLELGVIWNYDSATTFSYVAPSYPVPAQLKANNPGYVSAPNNQNLYFGKRGAGSYNSFDTFDLAVTYRIPVWKTVAPWVKVQVNNVFNDATLVTFDTSVSADTSSPLDANGLPTGFSKSPNFGTPSEANDYVRPREYFLFAGIRF